MVADDDAATTESGPSIWPISVGITDRALPSDISAQAPVGHSPPDPRQTGRHGRSKRDGAFYLFSADITTTRVLSSRDQENLPTEVRVDEGAVMKHGARSVSIFNRLAHHLGWPVEQARSQSNQRAPSPVY